MRKFLHMSEAEYRRYVGPLDATMVYLREIGRLRVTAGEILTYLHEAIGLEQDPAPFAAVAARALGQTWTRDPFDRIIVAQAIAAGAELVTKDETIRSHYPSARW